MSITQERMIDLIDIAEKMLNKWEELKELISKIEKQGIAEIEKEDDKEMIRFLGEQYRKNLILLINFAYDFNPPKEWTRNIMKERLHFEQVGRRNELNRKYKSRVKAKEKYKNEEKEEIKDNYKKGKFNYLNFDPKNPEPESNEGDFLDRSLTDDEITEKLKKLKDVKE